MPGRGNRVRVVSEDSSVNLELTTSDPGEKHRGYGSHLTLGKMETVQPGLNIQYYNQGLDLDEEAEVSGAREMYQDSDSVEKRYQSDDYGRDAKHGNIDDSSVRIEIRDMGHEGSSNFTTSTLHKCKKEVLRPYWHLLALVGWRALNKESIFAQSLQWRIVNALYTSTVIALLLYSYSYEVLACEWKLDVKLCSGQCPFAQKVLETTWAPLLENETSMALHNGTEQEFVSGLLNMKNNFTMKYRSKSELWHAENPACDHIITTYIIPNILHIIAYIIGFYHFRVQENEQLDALMEKVFLQATTVQARTASQQKMIKTQRHFLIIGGIWVFCSGLLQCLYMWAFDFPKMPIFENFHASTEVILFSLEIIGRAVFDSVILAIVMNFVTQCEMIKFYVRGLVMRLQEKSTDLKTAMKDMLMLRQSLSQLNGIISKMTTLVGVILAELTVIGVFLLLINKNSTPKMWAYRALFPVAWAFMLSLPLYQAARVNSICLRIKKVSLEMRVFGYKGASLLDLDSFMQFVHHTKLKAKLFHINVIPSHLIFSSIFSAFVLLILIQTSNIGPDNLFI
ncbi:hypothetical protein PoB_005848900 [Plakobranchus ocellatus]|uniref:Gustatory receptor n=1 Tax=Plakobranchus ocellatus TaxID=259542 RepID=A0AAV4CGV6_9GAST|nr:hypothetical protein PoB_005848900 [Plakobranchus ocellatus]